MRKEINEIKKIINIELHEALHPDPYNIFRMNKKRHPKETSVNEATSIKQPQNNKKI